MTVNYTDSLTMDDNVILITVFPVRSKNVIHLCDHMNIYFIDIPQPLWLIQ